MSAAMKVLYRRHADACERHRVACDRQLDAAHGSVAWRKAKAEAARERGLIVLLDSIIEEAEAAENASVDSDEARHTT